MNMEENRRDLQDKALVWNHITGVVNSMVLKTVINLDIADILYHCGHCPTTFSDLVSSLPKPCTNHDILRRLLRYMAHMQLLIIIPPSFDKEGEESYELTSAAKYIVKGHEKSLAPYAIYRLREHHLPTMHALDLSLSGDPETSTYEKLTGETLWSHAGGHLEHNMLFNEAMASVARMALPGLIEACKDVFKSIRSVVDVGGGIGTSMRGIAVEFPHLKCSVLDLPHVVGSSPKCEGVELIGGDMFEFVPQADVVLVMWVLHDWGDEKCLQILKRCKEAIPKDGGKVLIVDAVVDNVEDNELNHARLAMDIIMMAYTGGKERNEKEWKELLMAAGFTKFKITPIMALQHVIEATV